MKETKRDLVEQQLMEKFGEIRPYSPEESKAIERHKDGSFGASNLTFALYANGHNIRGQSTKNPYGLIFEDGENLFSIGYFRKESDPENANGYLFFVAPSGPRALDKIEEVTTSVLEDDTILCKGVYARFLTLEQYLTLLQKGFLPAKEMPWHAEAPEEDETYTNSVVSIDDLISTEESGTLTVNLVPSVSKNSKRKARDGYNRFNNFLSRNQFNFSLQNYTGENKTEADGIIKKHFQMLKERQKAIGSAPEDHLNMTRPELVQLRSVMHKLVTCKKKQSQFLLASFSLQHD